MCDYSLDEFAKGELREKVNEAIKQVINNIHDRDTAIDKPRKVIITLTFDGDVKRTEADVEINVQAKLQPKRIEAAHTRIALNNSKLDAPDGQMTLGDYLDQQSNVVQLGVRHD